MMANKQASRLASETPEECTVALPINNLCGVFIVVVNSFSNGYGKRRLALADRNLPIPAALQGMHIKVFDMGANDTSMHVVHFR